MAAKKKAAKPTKKAPAKKTVVKKAVKPAKKTTAKKTAVKKPGKPAKKAPAKKSVIKKTAKTVKNVVAKKTAKPVKKVKQQKTAKPVVKTKSTQKTVDKPATKKTAKAVTTVKNTPKAEKTEKKTTIIEKPVNKREEIKTTKNVVNKLIDIPLYSKPKETVVQQPKNKKIEIDTRTRYSDSELQEFKEIILKKLDEAKRDLELLRGSLTHTDDHGTDDTSPTFKMMEDGSETLSREETAQLLGRQEKFIQALESALVRIENKTYGICRVTGKLISKERLRLVPHTTLSIEAKAQQY